LLTLQTVCWVKASNKTRAAELAAKVVDKMIDPSAPPEERAQRRRRLTKGPLSFARIGSICQRQGKMSGDEKNTDRGLSAAERKELRGREAKQAVADHEAAEQAFHENRERLREERLAREATAGPMLYPAPELPDDTLIENVRFSTRIRKAVTAAGWKTVGEIREASDATLLGLQDLGPGSVTSLRETLGLPSTDGVRPVGLGMKAKK
jgi:predicted ribosome quality control (RQC) complex YloA/Tae2 family protein